jgi:pentatricopeptide repeat protein
VARPESLEEIRARELEEIENPRKGMNDGSLGEIHARRAKIGNRRHTPMPEPARDANDLTEKMTKWLRLSRKDSSLSEYLIACVQYFAGHPAEFRTTESWCIMITVALRAGDYNTTSELFGLMKAEGISRSSLTDAVELRYIILTKGWEAGWTYARSLTPSDAAGDPPTALPYHLWMKLAAPARRLTDSDSKARGRQDISDPQAILLLVEALPDLPEGTDVQKVQYAITLAKTLVQITATSTAMDFIRRYLHDLPASLDETMIKRCVDLINVAAYERSYFSSQAVRFFYKHCRMVDELLSIHSLLRPTTNTLLLLLANLEEADDPADHAVKLVARYQKLGGDDIVDERVQHRLAKLVHRSVERSQLLRKATTTLPQPQQERHWKRTEPGLKLDGQNGDDEVALAKANPER